MTAVTAVTAHLEHIAPAPCDVAAVTSVYSAAHLVYVASALPAPRHPRLFLPGLVSRHRLVPVCVLDEAREQLLKVDFGRPAAHAVGVQIHLLDVSRGVTGSRYGWSQASDAGNNW